MQIATERMPNFFIIGVVKGGTTSLYHYLSQHPKVYMSPIKETNHFSAADMQPEAFTREYALDVAIDLPQYFKGGMKEQIHIAHVDRPDDYRQLFAPANGALALGEVSTSYAICPSTAAAIKTSVPDAKLIVMLRNPVSRMWSQYLMNLREGKTAEDDFIKEIKADLAREQRGWGVSHQYHELGCYHAQLEEYLKHFDRKQIKVLVYEDYQQDAAGSVREVFDFLELDSDQEIDFSKRMNTAAMPRFKGLNDTLVRTGVMRRAKNLLGRKARQSLKGLIYSNKALPLMPNEARAYLKDYYRSEVEQLSDLLKRDFSTEWNFNEATA